MKNFEVLWLNKESYIYIKKDVTLRELNEFKDTLSNAITTFTKDQAGLN